MRYRGPMESKKLNQSTRQHHEDLAKLFKELEQNESRLDSFIHAINYGDPVVTTVVCEATQGGIVQTTYQGALSTNQMYRRVVRLKANTKGGESRA